MFNVLSQLLTIENNCSCYYQSVPNMEILDFQMDHPLFPTCNIYWQYVLSYTIHEFLLCSFTIPTQVLTLVSVQETRDSCPTNSLQRDLICVNPIQNFLPFLYQDVLIPILRKLFFPRHIVSLISTPVPTPHQFRIIHQIKLTSFPMVVTTLPPFPSSHRRLPETYGPVYQTHNKTPSVLQSPDKTRSHTGSSRHEPLPLNRLHTLYRGSTLFLCYLYPSGPPLSGLEPSLTLTLLPLY